MIIKEISLINLYSRFKNNQENAPVNPPSSDGNDSKAERVVAILYIDVLAAVATNIAIGGGAAGIAAVDGDWLAALGASDGDEI